MKMQGFFYAIAGVEAGGYPIALLIVILLLIFLKKHRVAVKKVLAAMNIFKAACASVSFVFFIAEFAHAWYSTNPYEQGAFQWRIAGPYWWSYWIMMVSSFALPQLFWFKRLRANLLISVLCVFSGRLFEYIMIVVTQLYRDYRPATWSYYSPRYGEVLLVFGLYIVCIVVVYFLLFLLKRKQTNTITR